MSNFVERLKEQMQDLHLSQKTLQSEYGITSATISDFLHGKNMPTYDSLRKLLNAFNCSADFLLGIDEFPTEESLYPVLPFADRFKNVLTKKNISQERIKRELPVSASVLYKWTSGKNSPSAISLIRLAKYLDCSVDFLIGRRR